MQPTAGMIRGSVIAAIVLVVFGAASATGWVVRLQLPSFTHPVSYSPPPPQPSATPPAIPRDSDVLTTAGWAVVTIVAVVVAGLIALGAYLLIRRLRAAWRPDDPAVDEDRLAGGDIVGAAAPVDLAALATAVGRAEAHLAGLAEPGDAVIAAWVALEDEAALQGAGRTPAQTATEFTSELLARTPAPPGAVTELRGVYQQARFTSRPVTPADVRRARDSLARIARALDAAAVGEPAGDAP